MILPGDRKRENFKDAISGEGHDDDGLMSNHTREKDEKKVEISILYGVGMIVEINRLPLPNGPGTQIRARRPPGLQYSMFNAEGPSASSPNFSLYIEGIRLL